MCQKPAVKSSRCHVVLGPPVRDPDWSRSSATAAAAIFSCRVVDVGVPHHLRWAAPAVCTRPEWQLRAFITPQRVIMSSQPSSSRGSINPLNADAVHTHRTRPPHVFICGRSWDVKGEPSNASLTTQQGLSVDVSTVLEDRTARLGVKGEL